MRPALCLLGLLLLPGPALAARSATWDRAKEVRSEAPLAPTPGHRAALRALVVDLLRAAPSGRVPADAAERAAQLGLVVERQGDRIWLVEPVPATPGEGRGNSLLAVHLGPLDAEVVVQAPHPFFDADTGAIAGKLLDDLVDAPPSTARRGVRAVILATAARHDGDDADPTREPTHLQTAMVDALDEALPDPLLVQLHGFAAETTEADGVVSVGPARSGRGLEERARIVLTGVLPGSDLRGPSAAPDLAATRNAQGLLLTDRVRFLHLELAPAWRDRLRSEAELREALREALLRLALDPGEGEP